MNMMAPRAKYLQESEVVSEGRYEECLRTLKNTPDAELRKLYQEREMEPVGAGEDWLPKDTSGL